MIQTNWVCPSGGARFRQTIVCFYPQKAEHWRWLAADGVEVCLSLERPLSAPPQRFSFLCPECLSEDSYKICWHEGSVVRHPHGERQLEPLRGCGREVSVVAMTSACPTCAKSATHRVLRLLPAEL